MYIMPHHLPSDRTMPSCARQLANCATLRPAPQKKPRQQAPTPLAPMTLAQGDNFVSAVDQHRYFA